jgi:hypothetical protein
MKSLLGEKTDIGKSGDGKKYNNSDHFSSLLFLLALRCV